MATVTVSLGNSASTPSLIIWPDDADLGATFAADGAGQILTQIVIYYTGAQAGTVNLSIVGDNNTFTTAFEATGRIIFETSAGEILEIQIANADMAEPYNWIPANSQEVIDFASTLSGLTNVSATLTLTDEPAVVTTDHTADAGDVAWTFAVSEPTVTYGGTTDHTVDAGDAAWTFAVSEPTVTYISSASLLALVDFDDTGLDVDAAALLVASAPGTNGNDPYANSDRAGTDTPFDGELGLSATETVISRVRRISATELVLNDNDNPSALGLGVYFSAGGDGSDLTLYLQTADDGLVSFAVADQTYYQRR